MSSKILDEKSSVLLHRKEVKAEVEYDAAVTSIDAAKKAIASAKKVDESLVVIKRIVPKYGQKKAVVEAYIYDSAEVMAKIEPRKKEKAVPGAPAPAAPAKKKK